MKKREVGGRDHYVVCGSRVVNDLQQSGRELLVHCSWHSSILAILTVSSLRNQKRFIAAVLQNTPLAAALRRMVVCRYEGPACDIDINECTRGTAGCAAHAGCTNTVGSYKCTCDYGYTGAC